VKDCVFLRVEYFCSLPDDFITLTRQLDAELNDRNGAWQAEYNVFNALDGIHDVVIAYDGETAVGCASMKRHSDGVYEIKRMFVVASHRRHGIAKQLMERLETEAQRQGTRELILETADTLTGALALYKALGYLVIPNYGQYQGRPHSVCFSKTTTPS
jgi:GNAT superfamily N-acetyltransferase